MNALDEMLLRSYLDDEMTEAEAEAFELLLLDRADLAELVEADAALRIGLSGSDHSETPRHPPAEVAPVGPRDPNSGLLRTSKYAPMRRRRRSIYSAGIAASLALAVGLGIGLLARQSDGVAFQPATVAYVDKLRDISESPRLPVGETGAVILMVPIAAENCLPTVRLQQEHGEGLQAQPARDEFGYAALVLSRDSVVLGPADVYVDCGQSPQAHYAVELVAAEASM